MTISLAFAPISLLIGNRIVAVLDHTAEGSFELRKRVDPARHQLRHPPAWALATAHLEELRRHGGARIVLEGLDGTRWMATLADFDVCGEGVGLLGYEPQRALRLPCWHVQRPGELALAGLVQ